LPPFATGQQEGKQAHRSWKQAGNKKGASIHDRTPCGEVTGREVMETKRIIVILSSKWYHTG